MNSAIWVALIGALSGGGIATAIIAWLRERKKDAAVVDLTNIQGLQQQLILLERVTAFLRDENARLQNDYEESEESRRSMRKEITRLREELEKVRYSARRTQEQCDHLSEQLQAFVEAERHDGK